MKVGWQEIAWVYRGTAEASLVVLSMKSPGEEKAEQLGVIVLQDGAEVSRAWTEVEGGGGAGD